MTPRQASGNGKGVSSSRLEFSTVPRASSRVSRRKIKDGIASPWIHKKNSQLQSSKISHKIPTKSSTRKSRRVTKRACNQYVKFFEDEEEKMNVQSLDTEFKNASVPLKSGDLKKKGRLSSRARETVPLEANEKSSEGKRKQTSIGKFNEDLKLDLSLSAINGDMAGASVEDTELSNGQQKQTSIDKSNGGLTFDSNKSSIHCDIDLEGPSADKPVKKFKINNFEKLEMDIEDIAVTQDVSLGIEVKEDSPRSWCSIA